MLDASSTANDIRKNRLNLQNGTDTVFNVLVFYLPAWVVCIIYFLGNETGKITVSWDDQDFKWMDTFYNKEDDAGKKSQCSFEYCKQCL